MHKKSAKSPDGALCQNKVLALDYNLVSWITLLKLDSRDLVLFRDTFLSLSREYSL